jgi:hypothetical protein
MLVNGDFVPLPLPPKQPRQATALVPTFYPRFDDPARALAIIVKEAATKSHLKIYLQRKTLYSVECEWQLPKDLSWNWTGEIRLWRNPTIDWQELIPTIEIKRLDKSVSIDGLIPGVYRLTATIWQWRPPLAPGQNWHRLAPSSSPVRGLPLAVTYAARAKTRPPTPSHPHTFFAIFGNGHRLALP